MLREIKSGLIEIRRGKLNTLPQKITRYSLRRFPKVKNYLLRKQMDLGIEKAYRLNAGTKAIFQDITVVYILNNASEEELSKSIISLKQNVTNPHVLFIDLSNNEDKINNIIQNYLPKSERIVLPPNERPNSVLQHIYTSNSTKENILIINEYARFNKTSNLIDSFEIDRERNYCIEFVHRSRDNQKSYYIRQKKVNFYENMNLFRTYFLLLPKERLNGIDLKNIFRSEFTVTPPILSSDIFEKDFDERNIFFNFFERSFETIKLSKGGKLYSYRFDFDKKVSIIILTRDKIDLLDDCIKSIEKSSYKNYEIIIVDHNSNEESKKYLDKLTHKVIRYEGEYNFAHMNNMAASYANGDVFCFLNNDTKVISEDWMEVLAGFAIQEDVGAVGAKLLFSNKTIQHAGIKLNSTFDSASHILTYEQDNNITRELNFITSPQAVTGACMFVESKKFLSVGGFNELYKTTWQDIDLCLTLSETGYKTLMIPYVKLYHLESKTRKTHPSTTERRDLELFQRKWKN